MCQFSYVLNSDSSANKLKANPHRSELQRLIREISCEPPENRSPFVSSATSETLQIEMGIKNLNQNLKRSQAIAEKFKQLGLQGESQRPP